MRILLIGSGGREHALAWKLAQSPILEALFAAPGNPGINGCATLVDLDPANDGAVVDFARKQHIDLVVIGPEQPLVAGLADSLAAAGIGVFGPSAAAAQLEGSKSFTKELCRETGIPTARYAVFDDLTKAATYLETQPMPIVVKADGLAAGKGVVVAATAEETKVAIEGSLALPGGRVVIEEYLEGTEASLFALSDGQTAIPFGTAQDYKRAGDGDIGPNTGGMGAISPAPALSPELVEQAMAEIIRPTIKAMQRRGTPFRGILYAGLMITTEGPKLIEYNVRLGDPECQALMARLDSDLATILADAAAGRLDPGKVQWSNQTAVTVVIANRGYPNHYDKGGVIAGIETVEGQSGVTVFQAGTTIAGEALVATGGRVLSVTALGDSVETSRNTVYAAVDAISWAGSWYRSDIGR